MAYATVLSLDQILEQISNPHLEQHQTPLQDQQIKSLQENLKFLLDFLDDSWQRRSEELRCLEREIRDGAYKIADIMESHISMNFGQESFHERQIRDKTFCENFEIVADEIDSIKTKAAKLKELRGATDLHQNQRTSLPTGQSRLSSIGKNAMVGFDEDLEDIRDRLTGYPPALQFIQVTGMGGSGKTTLARNVYSDPLIEHHFDILAWASISQEYREREVLLSLLDSTKQLSDEMHQENSTEEELKEYLYKSLKGRRYLVVMDDVWTTEAWHSLSRIFPDEGNGSRIMLTTRLTSSLVHESSRSHLHRMQFLNKSDSWNLLCRNVFGEDSCPSELEEAGKKIAENCKGLPLPLVVIGGYLSNANRTEDHWEDVAQNVKPTDANCLEILSLSYDYLPHYLKACFLYMGVFPEDYEIRVSKLIKLWVAEGFLKPVRGKTLEEVAEEYLGDLISRNLIMISKKSFRGKIKTCGIHDMLRDLCLKKAEEEKFFHVRDKDNIFAEIKYSRRLCIHSGRFLGEINCYQSKGSLPPVRSILISREGGRPILVEDLDESQINELVDGKLFPLLRVLDLKQLVRGFQLRDIKLVHSRYLAFPAYHEKVNVPKTLPDFLGYLQTLIVDSLDVHLPDEIWRMTQLRHLLVGKCYFPCPTRSTIAGENFVLGNLLTLSKVRSSSCTKEVFERVPNLNKLQIYSDYGDGKFSLGTLVNLPQLETLKIISLPGRVRVPINFTFPPNIKKLTLERCKIAWKHMTIVGSMPNLEVLKLLSTGPSGPESDPDWEPTEGEFCKLKFLLLRTSLLVQWRANNTNFTSLECLMLRGCDKLKEIPLSIGDIPTLQMIDLDDASPSAVFSAKQIQEEQENFGNNSLQVRVERALSIPVPKINELKAETIANFESNDDKLRISACNELSDFIFDSGAVDSPSEGFIFAIVPRLLEFLDRVDYPELQLAAARVIAKICLSDNIHFNILIEQGVVVPTMVSLLSSPSDYYRIKALEVLEMIASVSAESRDLVLSHGVLMPLLEEFNDKTKLTMMEQATRTLLQLCMRKPRFEQVKSAILPLAHLIHKNDKIVLRYACEALFHLTCGEMDMKQAVIDAVIEAGVFPRLFELLPRFRYPTQKFPSDALRIVDNIISYVDDTQIQVIIDNGSLPCLCGFLTLDSYYRIEVVTCRIISNIIGRTKDHIQAVIEAGIISPLLPLLQDADFFNAAAEVIYNVTTKGTKEQIKFLVDEGCLEPMCDLLVNPNEVRVIKICLEGLENIMKVGEAEKNQGNTKDVNVFAQMIVDAMGVEKIKNLQTHDNSKIREQAGKILETYW